MALNAAFAFEVRLTGNDANGGGFKAGATGTDRSLSDTPWATLTSASVVHTTTTQINVSAGDYTVTAADVGNAFQLAGGTGTAGVYEITAVDTVNNRWTVDRSVGTAGQSCPGKMGGAFASPGKAASVATVVGHTVFIKYSATPYVITTASTNVSGGCVSGTTGTAYVGYDTTRAVWVWPLQANRPTIQLAAGVTSATMFGNLNAAYFMQSMIVDANGQTGSRCTQNSGDWFYVKGMNGVTGGLTQNSPARAILCEATGCAALPINAQFCLWCVSHDNTLASPANFGAFQGSTASLHYGCIAYANNCDGFAGCVVTVNCIAYGNSLHGIDFGNQNNSVSVNCISESNGQWGYKTNAGYFSLVNCADFGNTSGRATSSSGGKNWGDALAISGTSSFFTNAAAQDFTLNNNAGGGALLRGAAFPASFPVPANSNFLDVGALQHLDAGGGGGAAGILVNPGMRGGMI